MNIDDVYPTRFLKASDLGSEAKRLTIASTALELMPDGQKKLCLWFSNAQKALVCNKTNSQVIAKAYGKETDGLIGKRIELFALTVQGPSGPVEGAFEYDRWRLLRPLRSWNSLSQVTIASRTIYLSN